MQQTKDYLRFETNGISHPIRLSLPTKRSRSSRSPPVIEEKLLASTLGQNIAYYRKARKLSKAQLAAIVGMNADHLHCIEVGRKYPRICILARLAAALGVSIKELVEER
ncbi:MAG: helix-turn-helix transcriptional regulator [Desulfosporosinus sp.]|nr:helix-turn-helix transcriptional regulator [Desulfosporosinus sp.]